LEPDQLVDQAVVLLETGAPIELVVGSGLSRAQYWALCHQGLIDVEKVLAADEAELERLVGRDDLKHLLIGD